VVVERLTRAWRAVREVSRGHGTAAPDERACGASGWQLRAGCTDGDGGAICPVCGRPVRTSSDTAVPRGVEVIEAHCA
jgi:hypothetical protein